MLSIEEALERLEQNISVVEKGAAVGIAFVGLRPIVEMRLEETMIDLTHWERHCDVSRLWEKHLDLYLRFSALCGKTPRSTMYYNKEEDMRVFTWKDVMSVVARTLPEARMAAFKAIAYRDLPENPIFSELVEGQISIETYNTLVSEDDEIDEYYDRDLVKILQEPPQKSELTSGMVFLAPGSA